MERKGQKQKSPVGNGAFLIFVMERETGFEPATSTLARLHSTAELLPQHTYAHPVTNVPRLINPGRIQVNLFFASVRLVVPPFTGRSDVTGVMLPALDETGPGTTPFPSPPWSQTAVVMHSGQSRQYVTT